MVFSYRSVDEICLEVDLWTKDVYVRGVNESVGKLHGPLCPNFYETVSKYTGVQRAVLLSQSTAQNRALRKDNLQGNILPTLMLLPAPAMPLPQDFATALTELCYGTQEKIFRKKRGCLDALRLTMLYDFVVTTQFLCLVAMNIAMWRSQQVSLFRRC